MPLYEFEGVRPDLPASGKYWIAPDATLIGKVRLLEEASVWFYAVLRGDNEWIEVGVRSNIQDGCVLHTDPGFPMKIGEGCTIGHKAILHGCTVGDNSLIGMGATVLNGAKIGKNFSVLPVGLSTPLLMPWICTMKRCWPRMAKMARGSSTTWSA